MSFRILFFIVALFLFVVGIPSVYADVLNVVPNAKHANDNTTEAISEITSDNSSVNPDTLSAVAVGDGVYTVDKSFIMQFTTFDISAIPVGSTISGAVLHLQYGAEDVYNGTNPVRYDNGSGLTSTGITPTDITGFSADLTYNLFSAGVDTISEIQNLDIEFTNNDSGSADAIHFDYLWITVTYTPPAVTTIGNGTNPSNSSIAPGASATDLDSLTLQTNTGTDTVTAAVVSLAAGSSGGLSLVAITNDAGSSTYCSQANPASDTVSLTSCGIPVTTSLVQFKIRVTPKSHANMPAPPGSTYSVTGTITSFTSTNSQSGTDTNSATVTIDNASPANVTSASGSAGDSQVSLSWTNPVDSDFHSSIVLRRASSAVADTPVEGTTYTVGNTIGSATVVCVVTSPTANCTNTGLTNDTAYHYKIFTRDTNANYSATGVIPTGSPFTPTAAPDTTAPAAITDLVPSNPSNSAITLTWTSPGDDGSSGTASSYDVRYSTSNITEGNWSSATQVSGEPTPLIAGTSQSMIVAGLSASTLYYFAMKTSDEVPNISAISNMVSLSTTATADTAAPAAITNLSLSEATVSTIKLTWTAPGDDGSSSVANSYDIRYSTLVITDANWSGATQVSDEPGPQVAGTSQSMTVAGLSASTLYYFAMKTLDEVPNTSAISNVPSGTTLSVEEVPAPTPIPVSIPRPEWEQFAPKRVLFSGSSYPLSGVELLRKESSKSGFQSLFDTKTTILSDGTFSILVGGLAKGEHFFGVRAQDPQGRNSSILSFAVSLMDIDNYEVKDIILSPTVEIKNKAVGQNEKIEVLGYAGRASTIEVEIDEKPQLQRETRVDSSGVYNFSTNASSFSPGIHYLRVRQRLLSGIASLFSTPISFKISLLSSPRADFNNDDKVNITDWSIFLYRWSSKDKELRKSIDLDQNNEINIGDFSIFLKSLTM